MVQSLQNYGLRYWGNSRPKVVLHIENSDEIIREINKQVPIGVINLDDAEITEFSIGRMFIDSFVATWSTITSVARDVLIRCDCLIVCLLPERCEHCLLHLPKDENQKEILINMMTAKTQLISGRLTPNVFGHAKSGVADYFSVASIIAARKVGYQELNFCGSESETLRRLERMGIQARVTGLPSVDDEVYDSVDVYGSPSSSSEFNRYFSLNSGVNYSRSLHFVRDRSASSWWPLSLALQSNFPSVVQSGRRVKFRTNYRTPESLISYGYDNCEVCRYLSEHIDHNDLIDFALENRLPYKTIVFEDVKNTMLGFMNHSESLMALVPSISLHLDYTKWDGAINNDYAVFSKESTLLSYYKMFRYVYYVGNVDVLDRNNISYFEFINVTDVKNSSVFYIRKPRVMYGTLTPVNPRNATYDIKHIIHEDAYDTPDGLCNIGGYFLNNLQNEQRIADRVPLPVGIYQSWNAEALKSYEGTGPISGMEESYVPNARSVKGYSLLRTYNTSYGKGRQFEDILFFSDGIPDCVDGTPCLYIRLAELMTVFEITNEELEQFNIDLRVDIREPRMRYGTVILAGELFIEWYRDRCMFASCSPTFFNRSSSSLLDTVTWSTKDEGYNYRLDYLKEVYDDARYATEEERKDDGSLYVVSLLNETKHVDPSGHLFNMLLHSLVNCVNWYGLYITYVANLEMVGGQSYPLLESHPEKCVEARGDIRRISQYIWHTGDEYNMGVRSAVKRLRDTIDVRISMVTWNNFLKSLEGKKQRITYRGNRVSVGLTFKPISKRLVKISSGPTVASILDARV